MDIMSSIKLSATGADQVVKEVGKVKKAFEDTASASKKVGGKVEAGAAQGGQGPSSGGSLGLGKEVRDFFDKKERENSERRRESNERERDNRSQSRTGGLPGRGPEQAARTGQGLVEPLAGDRADSLRAWGTGASRAGDFFKDQAQKAQERAQERAREEAAKPAPTPDTDNYKTQKELGSGFKSLAPLGMGIAGALFAAGGIVMSVVSTLAHREVERATMLWSSGISQRLSNAGPDSYNTVRSEYLARGSAGIPYQAITSFFSSLGQQGGGFQGLNTQRALATAMHWGIDPGAMGRTIGLRQQAGMDEAMPGYMMGRTSMPQGLMTRYVSAIGNAVEEGMRRGMNKSEIESFSRGTSTVLDAAMSKKGGNMSFTAAEALNAGITQQFSGGSQIGSAKEALLFMQMHKPGESTLDTMVRMRNPAEALKHTLSWAKSSAGGDKAREELNMMGQFGNLAPGLIRGLSNSSDMIMSGNIPELTRGTRTSVSGRGAEIMRASQYAPLAAYESKMVDVMGKMNGLTEQMIRTVESMIPALNKMASRFSSEGKKAASR